tara:strand:+ start:195 stop:956 length:762 start_codon:yes stop_codon:yes gene_type:complete
MKTKIKNLKSNIGVYKKYSHKMKLLENSCEGQTCYIIGCGPSLKDIDTEELKDKIKDDLVFTIKQSYFLFKDISDFHFFNCNNFTPFNNNNYTIYCSQADALTESIAKAYIWKNQQYDLNFVLKDNKIIDNRLSRSFDFNKWKFSNTLIRPWGPGIISETVFYMAQHLGISKIRTIGWDHTDPLTNDTTVEHFYNDKEYSIFAKASKIDRQELLESIELSKKTFFWLKEEKIDLEVFKSDKCFIDKEVNRFEF